MASNVWAIPPAEDAQSSKIVFLADSCFEERPALAQGLFVTRNASRLVVQKGTNLTDITDRCGMRTISTPAYEDDDHIQAILEDLEGAQTTFHHLCSLTEFDVLRAGQFRSQYHIAGQSAECALAFRDKIVMKNAIKEAELLVPDFSPVSTFQDIRAFATRCGFPVVLKPTLG